MGQSIPILDPIAAVELKRIQMFWKAVFFVVVLFAATSGLWADPSGVFSTPKADRYWIERNRPLIELGRQLFFDPRLSKGDQFSCASCHVPELGFSDAQATSVGVSGTRLSRNTPHLFNLEPQGLMFWDGRAQGLAEQALGPISAPLEMGLPLGTLTAKLGEVPGYRDRFDRLFDDGLTAKNIALALAAFERTLLSNNAPLDRYLAGQKDALSPAQKRGMALFAGKARCHLCHSGPNLTDNGFHNVGLDSPDLGRYALTKVAVNRGAFKTPGLRNVELTAPYMHNGSLKTLRQVIEFYDQGGAGHPNTSPMIEPLNLSEAEKADLLAFLNALSDPLTVERPQLPEGP